MRLDIRSLVLGVALSAALAGISCESLVGLDEFHVTSSLGRPPGWQ